MFPSLDTDLRWIPEDFEETGDDLVESPAMTTRLLRLDIKFGFVRMHVVEKQGAFHKVILFFTLISAIFPGALLSSSVYSVSFTQDATSSFS